MDRLHPRAWATSRADTQRVIGRMRCGAAALRTALSPNSGVSDGLVAPSERPELFEESSSSGRTASVSPSFGFAGGEGLARWSTDPSSAAGWCSGSLRAVLSLPSEAGRRGSLSFTYGYKRGFGDVCGFSEASSGSPCERVVFRGQQVPSDRPPLTRSGSPIVARVCSRRRLVARQAAGSTTPAYSPINPVWLP